MKTAHWNTIPGLVVALALLFAGVRGVDSAPVVLHDDDPAPYEELHRNR